MDIPASHHIKDANLAEKGINRIEWAEAAMPVLRYLNRMFITEQPLKGLRISGCLHITTETANLARTLQAMGADVVLCASNPLSTQDDVAAALVHYYGIPVFAVGSEDRETYYRHIQAALNHQPALVMDDGADLISELHKQKSPLLHSMLGGTEETTTGVVRLRAMEKDRALQMPIIAVNDAMTKHFFDNRYGTGQSALAGIIRATNSLLAGKVFVVVGYGWCGRGVSLRAKGHGAHVIVCEVDPIRALEANMDGYQVKPLLEAAACADFIVTVTGDKHVVDHLHFEVMKDGCVLANAGHFDVEINIPALAHLAERKHNPREHVEEFILKDGRRIRLLTQGRLVNLAAAEGHPAEVMDMSFANQILSLVYLQQHQGALENRVHSVPLVVDQEVARLKLSAIGLTIDRLTPEQERYLASWGEGT